MDASPRTPRLARFLRRAAAVVLALAAALLAAELVLRAIDHEPLRDAAGPRGLFVADERSGVWQAANYEGRHRHFEFDVRVRTDGLGLRIPEEGARPPTGPDERPVILCLGDSFTHGYGVAGADAWPARLDQLVAGRVHNAGVTRYGHVQMIGAFERLAPELAPDVVVFTHFFANDPEDNTGEFSTARGGVMLRPYFAGVIDASPLYTFAIERSQLLLTLCMAWVRARHGIAMPNPLTPPADPDVPPVPGGLEYLARELPPEAAHRLEVTAAAIGHLVERIRAIGARPVVLDIPLPYQLDEAFWHEVCATHGIDPAAFDLGSNTEWLRSVAAPLDLPVLDLGAGLREAGVGREAYYPHNQHWTVLGNRAIAERVAAFLVEHDLATRVP